MICMTALIESQAAQAMSSSWTECPQIAFMATAFQSHECCKYKKASPRKEIMKWDRGRVLSQVFSHQCMSFIRELTKHTWKRWKAQWRCFCKKLSVAWKTNLFWRRIVSLVMSWLNDVLWQQWRIVTTSKKSPNKTSMFQRRTTCGSMTRAQFWKLWWEQVQQQSHDAKAWIVTQRKCWHAWDSVTARNIHVKTTRVQRWVVFEKQQNEQDPHGSLAEKPFRTLHRSDGCNKAWQAARQRESDAWQQVMMQWKKCCPPTIAPQF